MMEVRWWIYTMANGIYSGIPRCCVRSFAAGYTGTNMIKPDPLENVQYIRCPKCIDSDHRVEVKKNGRILGFLVPW